MKKVIALMLALVLVLSLAACGGGTDQAGNTNSTEDNSNTIIEIPSYENASILKSGKCGNNAEYTLYDNEVLVIKGTGIIEGTRFSMFNDYTKYIKIENGITETAGSLHAPFSGMENLLIVELPDTLTRLGENAFSGASNLEYVNLPKGLKEIGAWAFSHCESLKKIEIPSSVEYIGKQAFVWCSSCKELILHEGIQGIGKGAFSYNKELEMVYVPGSVSYIDEEVFKDCDKLSTVVLGEGVTQIGKSAFENITTFAIPDSVTYIDYSDIGMPNPTTKDSKVYCNMNSYASQKYSSIADVVVGYDGFMKDFDLSKYK